MYDEIPRRQYKGRAFDARLRAAFDGETVQAVDTRTAGTDEGRDGRANVQDNGGDARGQQSGRVLSGGESSVRQVGVSDEGLDVPSNKQDSVGEPVPSGDSDTTSDLARGQSGETQTSRSGRATDPADGRSDAGTRRSSRPESGSVESVDGRPRDTADGGVAPARSNFRITNELDSNGCPTRPYSFTFFNSARERSPRLLDHYLPGAQELDTSNVLLNTPEACMCRRAVSS